MDADNSEMMVGPLPLPGICNLCSHDGIVRSMLMEHEHDGIAETYIEMILRCFSIDMLNVDLQYTKRLICNACIEELQRSISFREKVEASLTTLEATMKLKKQSLKNVREKLMIEDQVQDSDKNSDNNMEAIEDPKYDIKEEYLDLQDGTDAIDLFIEEEDSDDYCPKMSRNIKLSNAEKGISDYLKKSMDTTVTKEMLKAGLFPFKICKNRFYSCIICPQNFTSLDDIKTHVLEHCITDLHIAFKEIGSSKLHRFFKSSNKLRCNVCKTDLSNYKELKHHMEDCLYITSRWKKLPSKDQFECPNCNKKFLNIDNLCIHMKVHNPKHTCESCGKSFASRVKFEGHMRRHKYIDTPHANSDPVCDGVSKKECRVTKNPKTRLRYICKRCNISLPSVYKRVKHLAEVHNEELKRYKCKACTQSYITPGHLSNHVRRYHLNERNHKCDKCDLAFYTNYALRMHMIKHDGERIHTCHICQKSYQRLKTLKEHMRIHNNDKRFVCTVCGKAFTQKCTLGKHLRVHERKLDGKEGYSEANK